MLAASGLSALIIPWLLLWTARGLQQYELPILTTSLLLVLALFLLPAVLIGIVTPLLTTLALAPWLAPYNFSEQHILHAFKGPTAKYWLGTDEFGRDLFSRIIWGTRPALLVGVLSVLVSMGIGVPIGVLAGYKLGRVDRVVSWLVDIMLSFPALLLGLMILMLASTGVLADKVRIGTEGAYPPFNMIDREGKVAGFDVDIARALCDKMGIECVFVTQDWDGIIPGLMAGKYDAIVASMSITEERKQAVDFTNRYYSNSLRMIAKKGAAIDPANLDGKVVGAQRATIAANYAEKIPDVSVKLYDTQENAYLDLGSGRVDVLVTDMLPGFDWLNSDQGKGFEFIGENIDINDRIGIAVRKGDDKLRQRLNKALEEIVGDGTYEKINAKYFPFSIY